VAQFATGFCRLGKVMKRCVCVSSVLQCVAGCCSVLQIGRSGVHIQCVAVCCSSVAVVFQCVAVVLQCIAVCCSVLQRVAMWCRLNKVMRR